jgi:hypothetical protein
MNIRVSFFLAALTIVLAGCASHKSVTPTSQSEMPSIQTSLHEQWLQERLNEARSIKVGSTFSALAKHFAFDGGPNGNDGYFRCDLISCPSIKIDVVLVDSSGKKIKLSIFDKMPADVRVSSVSKPYRQEPISD